ncbi:MAG: 50S ribosomal protein L11 methyltransferase [Bacteroidales bacterium]
MVYTEVTITIPGNITTGSGITIAELAEAGFESFEETSTGVRAWIPAPHFSNERVRDLTVFTSDEFTGSDYSVKEIAEANWNSIWEENYPDVSIGRFCHIRALFHQSSGNYKHEIVIEPKMSFGTGHHETTRLVAGAMENIDFSGKRVLDLGCGTGVLAILASMMGAGEITAVDIDEWSVINSRENCINNGCTNITILHGDISVLPENKVYDIILANITRNVLTGYMKNFGLMLAGDGSLITSGFYRSDLDVISEAAGRESLFLAGSMTEKEWTMALFTK